jgi:hypothetical protein
MIRPQELAIADVMSHSLHGLVSFQPACDDRADATYVPVRNIKGKLLWVHLDDCNWPKEGENRRYWAEFPGEESK